MLFLLSRFSRLQKLFSQRERKFSPKRRPYNKKPPYGGFFWLYLKRVFAGIDCLIAKRFFDAQKLVVFRDSVRSRC